MGQQQTTTPRRQEPVGAYAPSPVQRGPPPQPAPWANEVAHQIAEWSAAPAFRADPGGFVADLRRRRGKTAEYRIPFDPALAELERLVATAGTDERDAYGEPLE